MGLGCLLVSAVAPWYKVPGVLREGLPMTFLGNSTPHIQFPFRIVIGTIGALTAALLLMGRRANLLVIGICSLVFALLFPHMLLMLDPPAAMQTAFLAKQASALDLEIHKNYVNKGIPWDQSVTVDMTDNRLTVFRLVAPGRYYLQLANISRWIEGFGLSNEFLQFARIGWALAIAGCIMLILGHYLSYRTERVKASRRQILALLGLACALGTLLVGRIAIANYHLYQARDYAAQGVYQESLKSYYRALKWIPTLDSNSEFHLAVGAVYYESNMEQEADYYNYLGTLYLNQADFRMAQVQYERALAIRRNHPIARLNLMTTLLDLGMQSYNHGQYASACTALEKVVQLDPNNLQALYQLAACYLHVGSYALAEDALGKVITLQGCFQIPAVIITSQAYFRLGWANFEQGRYNRALEFSRKAVDISECN